MTIKESGWTEPWNENGRDCYGTHTPVPDELFSFVMSMAPDVVLGEWSQGSGMTCWSARMDGHGFRVKMGWDLGRKALRAKKHSH
jgi:hypothetical protein